MKKKIKQFTNYILILIKKKYFIKIDIFEKQKN